MIKIDLDELIQKIDETHRALKKSTDVTDEMLLFEAYCYNQGLNDLTKVVCDKIYEIPNDESEPSKQNKQIDVDKDFLIDLRQTINSQYKELKKIGSPKAVEKINAMFMDIDKILLNKLSASK